MVSIKALKSYCSGDITKIENYEKAISDPDVKWVCHHRREDLDYSRQDLINQGLYYKVSPEDLILLTLTAHRQLYMTGERNNMYGKKHPEETKKKISKAMTGKMVGEKNPMYGKKRPEETKKKISKALTGKHTTTPKVRCLELGIIFVCNGACDRYIREKYNDKWFQVGKILKHPEGYYPKLGLHFEVVIDNPNQLSLEL